MAPAHMSNNVIHSTYCKSKKENRTKELNLRVPMMATNGTAKVKAFTRGSWTKSSNLIGEKDYSFLFSTKVTVPS